MSELAMIGMLHMVSVHRAHGSFLMVAHPVDSAQDLAAMREIADGDSRGEDGI